MVAKQIKLALGPQRLKTLYVLPHLFLIVSTANFTMNLLSEFPTHKGIQLTKTIQRNVTQYQLSAEGYNSQLTFCRQILIWNTNSTIHNNPNMIFIIHYVQKLLSFVQFFISHRMVSYVLPLIWRRKYSWLIGGSVGKDNLDQRSPPVLMCQAFWTDLT